MTAIEAECEEVSGLQAQPERLLSVVGAGGRAAVVTVGTVVGVMTAGAVAMAASGTAEAETMQGLVVGKLVVDCTMLSLRPSRNGTPWMPAPLQH